MAAATRGAPREVSNSSSSSFGSSFRPDPPRIPAAAAVNCSLSKQEDRPGVSAAAAGSSPVRLHLLCCDRNSSQRQIRDVLKQDPGAASRSSIIQTTKLAWPVGTLHAVTEPYTYPLHLAIRHGIYDPVVVGLLADAAPFVLGVRDSSREGEGGDTPLHIACSRGAPLSIVRLLARAHPPAIHTPNFDLKTPFQLSCERAACPGNVAAYLRAAAGTSSL